MNLARHIASSVKFNGNFCIIGIDGPTASGKTTLADSLAEELKNKHIPCFIYRLDWTLLPREHRLQQLDGYIERKTSFEYEADLHMNLDLAAEFLASVEKFRNKIFISEHLTLEGLYNRDDNGKCNGISELNLIPQMVILVEGHYTHHWKLRRFFDMNYLLIASPAELLRRKIARVGAYRDAELTTDYFNLVDLPSFRRYFSSNIVRFSNILLNEQFKNQLRVNTEEMLRLFFPDNKYLTSTLSGTEEQSSIFALISCNHNRFVQLWGIHQHYRTKGFSETLESLLEESQYGLAYLNVYMENSNHFSYHFGLHDNDNLVLVAGSDKKIEIIFRNAFSLDMFELTCLGNTMVPDGCSAEWVCRQSVSYSHYILIPNRLLLPRFLKDIDYCEKVCFLDSSHVFDNLIEIFVRSSFCVFRPESQEESDFLRKFLSLAGFTTHHLNNYIFSCSLNDKRLIDNYDFFIAEYGNRIKIMNRELGKNDISNFEKCGCQYIDKSLSFTEKTNYNQLGLLYGQFSLVAKKLLTDCLCRSHPDVEIATGVNAESYIESLPATLNEFYFALSVSGMGAVPFLSVYDLKETGLDVATYFDYFSDASVPFGLQASLNALGNAGACGYLKIDGPEAMSVSIRNHLITFLRNHPGQDLPLWSLAVDHAVIEPAPGKRGQLLLKEAAATNWVKSFCIDLTALLGDGNIADMEYLTNQITELISPEVISEADIEFYVGDEKLFENMPDEKAIRLYSIISSLLQGLLSKFNLDPVFLLGPFLGTLHHQLHNRLNPEFSQKVYNACSKHGVMGNVLHGTSFTPYDSIQEMVHHGCVRVNFAGKFLFALVNGFPPYIRKSLGTSQTDIKTALPYVSPKVASEAMPAVSESLGAELNSMLNAEVGLCMCNEEIRWFRKSNYFLPDDDFKMLMSEMTKYAFNGNSLTNNGTFLASMIEVPYEVFASGLVKKLIDCGITYFHVDVGDGEYISRPLDGYEKLTYLQKYFPEATTHLHLMVKNPFSGNGKSYVARLAAIKQSLMYLHPEAYDKIWSWKYGATYIRQKDCTPGVVLTIDEKVFTGVLLEKMKQAGLHHLLVMGVPVGRGGQSFVHDTIPKIEFIREWSAANDYEIVIEVDGGLSDSVINKCIAAGATFLSGWSMFLKYGIDGIEKRVKELMNGHN